MNNNLMNKPPFFVRITAEDKELKSMRYVYDGDVYNFQTDTSKTVQSKTLEKICAGLNHMLLWAKSINNKLDGEALEKDIRLKRDFIIQFSSYIYSMHKDLTDENFTSRCTARISESDFSVYNKRPDMNDIRAEVLVEWIDQLLNNDVLVKGIIKYVYEYTNINSLDINNKNKYKIETKLNKYDLFALMVVIPISKIIYLAFSVYHTSTKADVIVIPAINRVLEVISDKIISFYTEELVVSPTELNEMLNNSFQDNLVEYISGIVEKRLDKEKNRSVFENIGVTSSIAKNNIFQTTLSAIFKVLPVFDSGENAADTTISYSFQEDWHNYRFVSNTVIGYMNKTIKDNMTHTSSLSTNVVTNTISVDSSDSGLSYKQEMFLESRDNTSLLRKKHILKLLNKWATHKLIIYTSQGDRFIYDTPLNETPIRAFLLTSLLSEIAHDITTYRLMDKHTRENICVVLSYRLRELGFIKLSKAIMAKAVTMPNTVSIDMYLSKIRELKKCKINPVKVEKYIKDLATRAYIFKSEESDKVEIIDELLAFMKAKESGKLTLIEEHLYQYENK